MDALKLTGDTLQSVNKVQDEEEERIYAEIYRELESFDRRPTRTRRGRGGSGRGVQVGSRGCTVRGAPRDIVHTYVRRGSGSSTLALADEDAPFGFSHELREPEFDDEGNLLSDGDFGEATDVSSSHEDDFSESSDSDAFV